MDRRIKAAIEIMLHDERQRVNIRELAQQVNLSPGRFSKLFKAETFLTPGQFARYRRLQQAKELLAHSFLKVNEIAAAVGFRHVSSFTREFKNFYGHPPSVSRGGGPTEPGTVPARKRGELKNQLSSSGWSLLDELSTRNAFTREPPARPDNRSTKGR